jgi:3'-phosphoadenosine 5'-phosphosulfate sulfotransferase (PAPS reductase)/FAD synthetase
MDRQRHVVALSGGKDSAALAVYLREKHPDLDIEYVFTDSGCELPETYEYLDRIRAVLNIDITVIKSQRNFDYWLKYYNGVLPSPQSRWCTRHLKIEPYEDYLGDSLTYSYIAIRADEDREGYRNDKGNIIPMYPFIEDNIDLQGVIQILERSGLGLPDYYKWRKRSGCYFCFFQSDREWLGLREQHPSLFEKACCYEENHADGRVYTWRDQRAGLHQHLRDLDWEDISEVSSRSMTTKDSRLLHTIANMDSGIQRLKER